MSHDAVLVSGAPIVFPVTIEEVRDSLDRFRGLTFSTPAQAKEARAAIAVCRNLRGDIEERRKLLKKDSLDYGRAVDAMAKSLTAAVLDVETPLQQEKEAAERAKRTAAENAARLEREALEREVREQREAEERALAAVRKEEEARLKTEREAIAKEREALLQAQAELDSERRRHARELEQIRQAREVREEQEKAERIRQEAREAAERRAQVEREQAEEARINQAEAEASRAKRWAALKPDQDKLSQLARALRQVVSEYADYTLDDSAAEKAFEDALQGVTDISSILEHWRFTQPGGPSNA